MSPAPLAILGYYSIPSISTPLFNSSKILGPPGTSPMLQSQIQHLLDESATVGSTPASRVFDPSCLSPDLSQNLDFETPSEDNGHPARLPLVRWLLQTNAFPALLEDVDKGLEHEGWQNFPDTVLVHGDADVVVPFQMSEMLVDVIGKLSLYFQLLDFHDTLPTAGWRWLNSIDRSKNYVSEFLKVREGCEQGGAVKC
jgi:hypothetical protein